MALFNRFALETPESVELEFTLAGIGNRAYALAIDYLALGLLIIVLMLAWALFAYFCWELLNIDRYVGSSLLGMWFLAIQILIIFACYVGYFVFFETLWQGQTPGKRFNKIRVIRDDGRPIGLPQATLRALLRPIDDLLYVGMFFIIFGRKEKRIGDWVAGTLVIQENTAIAHSKNSQEKELLTLHPDSKNLAQHLLETTSVEQLLPDQFATIREYLHRREDLLPDAKKELGLKLAHQAKEIIHCQEVPPNVSANLFLEAVYLAYQQPRSNSDAIAPRDFLDDPEEN